MKNVFKCDFCSHTEFVYDRNVIGQPPKTAEAAIAMQAHESQCKSRITRCRHLNCNGADCAMGFGSIFSCYNRKKVTEYKTFGYENKIKRPPRRLTAAKILSAYDPRGAFQYVPVWKCLILASACSVRKIRAKGWGIVKGGRRVGEHQCIWPSDRSKYYFSPF